MMRGSSVYRVIIIRSKGGEAGGAWEATGRQQEKRMAEGRAGFERRRTG